MVLTAPRPRPDIPPISAHQRKAMQWQHTRCRIGTTTLKDRHGGVPDIGMADEYVWSAWYDLTDLLWQNRVKSACMFGTLHDGCTFTMLARGNENINLLIGACTLLLHRLATYEEMD